MTSSSRALLDSWAAWQGALDCAQTGALWSADSLREESSALARRLLESGIAPGVLVALVLANTAAFPVALLGLLELGAHPVLLPAGCRSSELEILAARCGFQWALHDFLEVTSGLDAGRHAGVSRFPAASLDLALLELESSLSLQAPSTDSLDPAGAILHATSGTYGHASFCIRDQRVAVAEADNFIARVTPYDRARVRIATPLSHAHAYGFGLVGSLRTHSTLVLESHFNPKVLLAREQEQPSDLAVLVPPMVRILHSLGSRAPSPRFAPWVFTGGASCPEPTLQAFQDTFGSRLFGIYGSTETGGIASNFSLDGPAAAGVGSPLPGVTVSLGSQGSYGDLGPGTGEVLVQSTSMMQGYWGARTHWRSAGTHATGDLARLEDGQLVLVGRIREVINLGGLKVDPAEVEAVLLGHPAVADAAVYPGRGSDDSEFVQAAVQLQDPSCEVAVLRAYCAERLEASKVPLQIHRLERLPRTPSGKCLKIRCPGFPARRQ